ncbi:MAG TPA: hypothetical protein VHP83_09705 [Aggregatilineaceae bacterium]|nr:hypothetical protein [Aggregatilineaceae bacterium]
MKKILLIGTLLIILLAACGGKEEKSDKPANGGTVATPVIRATSARGKPEPSGDPFEFEAPITVGNFNRESESGNVTTAQMGGVQATYGTANGEAVVVNTYHFETFDQAVENLRWMLDAPAVQTILTQPNYEAHTVVLGVAQDRQGGHMAVWVHYEWLFVVRTPGSLEVLQAFLEAFPY